MKKICLILALLLLLPGCGRTLDAETLALAEESDIVCLARIAAAEAFPEPEDGGYCEGYCILKCWVKTDYLRNLKEGSFIYVLLEGADLDMSAYRDRFRGKTKYSGALILFLKHDPEDTVYHGHRPLRGEFRVFVPAGRNAVCWGGDVDAEGLRLQEALRTYGKAHPREPVEKGVYEW